jgi:hypothetical protein
MKVKVDSLIGPALNWAVVKCEEPVGGYKSWVQEDVDKGIIPAGHHYSTDWLWGGPIIERERITIEAYGDYPNWVASLTYEEKEFDGVARAEVRGTTPLIAAMRAYVASKMGDEIEVPEELQ